MKKALLLSIISGLLLGFSWPVYGFTPLIFIAFVPLLLVISHIQHQQITKSGFKIWMLSYLSFLIWNSITTWWIVYSTTFGMLFAVLVNSLLMSFVMVLFYRVSKILKSGPALIFLVTLWLAFEKFHLGWEFSWPWLNLGNVFSENIQWIQWYEYTGVFGGTLWIWLVNLSFFKIANERIGKKKKLSYKSFLLPTLLVLLPILVSVVLLKSPIKPEGSVNILIVQPNVDPYSEKYNTTNSETLKELKETIKQTLKPATDIIITPETMFAEGFGERLSNFRNNRLFFEIQEFSKENKVALLSGIQFFNSWHNPGDITSFSNKVNDSLWYDVFNSAVFIDEYDQFEVYHKSKLVVGVENFPYKTVLQPLVGDALLDLGGTIATRSTQNHREVLYGGDPDIRVAAIICYESVYGEFVARYARNGANFLAIITNDGWWSNSQGHKQHLSYARLRAIETRRAVVRSANTGISAIINPKGYIEKELPYNSKGLIEGRISTYVQKTFYVRYGDLIARLAVFVAVFLFLRAVALQINSRFTKK